MAKLLKELYNQQYILTLQKNILKNYASFDTELFEQSVFNKEWETKELKERMRHIALCLNYCLPNIYDEKISILIDTFNLMDSKNRLENMIFQDFVEVFGLEHFELSMKALEIFTNRCSSEFAIRQFILKYPNQTMKQMRIWTKSKNEHHRRLASEGCRSRLPWAIALHEFKKDPSEILKILELLKDDNSVYVRKSVANNLNDISKDNPDIVKKILKEWFGKSGERDALLKHGCRTLLKQSDKDILNVFGFFEINDLKLKNIKIDKSVNFGESLEFSFEIVSKKKLGKLRIEYMLEFLRQNKNYSKKVFKISEGVYDTNTKNIKKKHSFKKISTRKYYEGVQKISIIINGKLYSCDNFLLI